MEKKILLHDEIAHLLIDAHDAAPTLDKNFGTDPARLAQYTLRHIEVLETIVLRLAREVDSLRNA